MKEIRIRGLESHVISRLQKISKRSYHKSFNQYLVSVLTELAESDGMLPLEKEIYKRHSEVATHIQKNTEAILKAIDCLNKMEGE